MPTIQLPEAARQKCSHRTANKVSSHENCIDTVRSARVQFEDTCLVAKLDALHPYVNDDDSGNDTNKSVLTDEEQ